MNWLAKKELQKLNAEKRLYKCQGDSGLYADLPAEYQPQTVVWMLVSDCRLDADLTACCSVSGS